MYVRIDMNCTIKINMDNAAFDDLSELSRILRKAADRLDGDPFGGFALKDVNGNTVGFVKTGRSTLSLNNRRIRHGKN